MNSSDQDPKFDAIADLAALSDAELRAVIDELTESEQQISYQRRVLHGKIDILRAELVSRLRVQHQRGESIISGADVEQLTNILAMRH